MDVAVAWANADIHARIMAQAPEMILDDIALTPLRCGRAPGISARPRPTPREMGKQPHARIAYSASVASLHPKSVWTLTCTPVACYYLLACYILVVYLGTTPSSN